MTGRLSRALGRPLLGLLWLYRNGVSPLLGANCRFQPTCSAYAEQALRRYGAFRGGRLALLRMLRCHPWGGAGYDPVPEDAAGRERSARTAPQDPR